MSTRILMLLWLMASPLAAEDGGGDADRYWPQWRGPRATGTGPHADPPVQWSEQEHIRWKVPLPGRGHSTPVIWGDRIFLTTAISYGDGLEPRYSGAPGAHDNSPVTQHHKFEVLAVDRRDGHILWQRTVCEALPHEGGHTSGSMASSSPVTDGEHLFAFFGSRGIYCLDLEGKPVWSDDLGHMQTKHGHGEGSSPALYGKTLLINWDHEGQSFVIAYDKASGKRRWKIDRREVTSWASPIVVEHAGIAQVIVSGTDRVRSYDLANGRVIWACGGLSANVVASPVAGDGMVYAASSYEKRALLAIQLEGAAGDITSTEQVLWSRRHRTPYVPSPLLYGRWLYFLSHYQGILSRVEARTGAEALGPFRLEPIRNVYASPVGAAGRIYITDLDGTTMVISHGGEPKVLAINRLEDSFSASAALVDKELVLRGLEYLYCIVE